VATILIIESDRSVAALLAAVVERVGATPLFDLELNAGTPDILLMEPSVTGAVALANVLRAVRPELPIVFVCATMPTTDPQLLPKPTVLILKPFAPADLQATLSALLAIPEG
jgi:DNA-binding response OmpR family regulator